jgi:hypothetical protein
MIVGSAIVAASIAWLAVTEAAGSYWTGVFGPMLGIGLGMAVAIAPLTTTVMNALGEARSGAASGINNAAARVAGLVAVAITGGLMAFIFARALPPELALAGTAPDVAAAILDQSGRLLDAPVPETVGPEQGAVLRAAMGEAYEHAFRWGMLLNAALALAAALVGAALPVRAGRKAEAPAA